MGERTVQLLDDKADLSGIDIALFSAGASTSREWASKFVDAGAVVPGALVVRADFAKEHPDDVAKFLAVYLRGWSWAKANPKEARTLALDFYKQGGLEVTERAMDQEFALRPTFLLDDQLKIMSRAGGASTVDGWFSEIGKFMTQTGTIPASPDAKDYITDDYLKRVAADPKLRAFATEFDKK